LKRFTGARLMSRAGEKSVFSGWLTKVPITYYLLL